MILALAKIRGYNVLMCYLPIALLNFVVGIGSLIAMLVSKKPLPTRDSFTSMNAKHVLILGFTYTFGYMIPTIRLI